jgi:hypothetical protein
MFSRGGSRRLPRALSGSAARFAKLFEEESAPEAPEGAKDHSADIFAEMGPFMVDGQDADDSREGIYTRKEGE